jgi:LysM repeat protein
MPAIGKHRRRHSSLIGRGIIAAGAGVAVTLPVIGATSASAATPAAAPKAAQPTTHTVVAGETLYRIALKHSVSGGWEKLYENNKKAIGSDPHLIRPGLKLAVSGKAAAPAMKTTAVVKPAAAKAYPNNLDGWIRESLDVMAKHNIPGTYNGIHKNVMRESSGNPMAINNWDINAINGVPSKGLLQVIKPTFDAYHVSGTSLNMYDPVANITAACNYAADRYGSIDNVNGPY